MPNPAEDRIVHNLMEALEQLRQDLDKVEMWAAALNHFQRPAPQYEPNNQYILPPPSQSGSSRPRI